MTITRPTLASQQLFQLLVAAVLVGALAPGYITSAQIPLPDVRPGESVGHALGLSAALNLRDLGGYKTRDGRTVKRGLVYRSDVFHPMSKDDLKKLGRLGLKQDYDLRTIPETKARPDQVPDGVKYVSLNVAADQQSAAVAQLEALLHDPRKANAALGGGKVESLFAEAYREFISLPSAKRAYRTLFLALADTSKLPAVFHCTTGKDRTGWAAAALLTLLGVPRETVMADYLRSNDYLLPYYEKSIDGFVAGGGDRAVAIAILGVKRQYLEASFDEVEKTYGTIESYFTTGLGIDPAGQKTLRDLHLTK